MFLIKVLAIKNPKVMLLVSTEDRKNHPEHIITGKANSHHTEQHKKHWDNEKRQFSGHAPFFPRKCVVVGAFSGTRKSSFSRGISGQFRSTMSA